MCSVTRLILVQFLILHGVSFLCMYDYLDSYPSLFFSLKPQDSPYYLDDLILVRFCTCTVLFFSFKGLRPSWCPWSSSKLEDQRLIINFGTLHTFLFKYACFLWHELDYINISFFSALTQKNTLYDLDNLGATSNSRWDQFHVRVWWLKLEKIRVSKRSGFKPMMKKVITLSSLWWF